MSRPSRSERSRVELANEADIHYWSQHFRVSEYVLWKAVTTVGDSLSEVERYINEVRPDGASDSNE
jgi:hypothetical protein